MAPVISRVELQACRFTDLAAKSGKRRLLIRLPVSLSLFTRGRVHLMPPIGRLLNVAQTNRDEPERSSFGWRPSNMLAVRSRRPSGYLDIRCRARAVTPLGALRVQRRGAGRASALGGSGLLLNKGGPGTWGGAIGGPMVQPLINLD